MGKELWKKWGMEAGPILSLVIPSIWVAPPFPRLLREGGLGVSSHLVSRGMRDEDGATRSETA